MLLYAGTTITTTWSPASNLVSFGAAAAEQRASLSLPILPEICDDVYESSLCMFLLLCLSILINSVRNSVWAQSRFCGCKHSFVC